MIALLDQHCLQPPTDADTDAYFAPPPADPRNKRKRSDETTGKRTRARKKDGWSDRVVVTLTERVDPDLVRRLLAHLPEDSEERKGLVRYSAALNEAGELAVDYRYKSHGMGRLYPRDHRSLGTLKRELRGALCAGRYVDVDIKNAHPTILRQECERRGWPCAALAEYIDNREATLARISPDRDKAKVAVLSLINNSGLGEFRDNQYILQLYRELRTIRERIWETYENFRRIVQAENRSNEKASVTSFFMMFHENRILLTMYRHLEAAGWDVATLVYDGLMVYRRDEKRVEDTFDAMRRAVEEECGFRVLFEVKQWNRDVLRQFGMN